MNKTYQTSIYVPPFDNPQPVTVISCDGRPSWSSIALVHFKSTALCLCAITYYADQAISTYLETGNKRVIPAGLAVALGIYAYRTARNNYRKLRYTAQFHR